MKKKYHIYLTYEERQGIVHALNDMRNTLINTDIIPCMAHVEIIIIEQTILSEGTGLVILDIVIDEQLSFVQLIA